MTTRHRQTRDKTAGNSNEPKTLGVNKNKNWRVSYLRALNIFTPDLAMSMRGRRVSSSRADTRRAAFQPTSSKHTETTMSRRRKATVTDEAMRRPSSRNSSTGRFATSKSPLVKQFSKRSGSSSRSRSHSDDSMSRYAIGSRSRLARARRLAPWSDLVLVDPVSVPIEIPTGTSTTLRSTISSRAGKFSDMDSRSRWRLDSTNDFQTSNANQLLSWEDPSMMLGRGICSVESEKRNKTSIGYHMSAKYASPMTGGRSRRSSCPDGIAEVCEDFEDMNVLTNSEDDNEEIFTMEFGSNSSAGGNVATIKRRSDCRLRTDPGRRRLSGLNESIDDKESGKVTTLSASFVPPHQLVKRTFRLDCTSDVHSISESFILDT